MRRRIQNLSLGLVQEKKPEIRFSVNEIKMTVYEDETGVGAFTVKSRNRVPFRGLLYSDNPWVKCKENSIQGEMAEVTFEARAGQHRSGDTIEGEILFISNAGEHRLPYQIQVEPKLPKCGGHTVHSLEEFAVEAELDFANACKLFLQDGFLTLARQEGGYARLSASAFRQPKHVQMNLEEFLVSLGLKERITIQVEGQNREFTGLSETKKESITLTKSTWGYTELMLSSSASFLVLPKSKYTSEDFVGNQCTVGYYLDEKALHAGWNRGELIIKTPYETLRTAVCVRQPGNGKESVQQTSAKLKILRDYMDFRLGRKVKGEWTRDFLSQVSQMLLEGEEKWFYELMSVQALIINRQRQDAETKLETFARFYQDKTTQNWAYYLYLTTLLNREPHWIRKKTEEIKSIYKKNRKSRLIFWILLYLDTDYEDGSYKMMELENQSLQGFISPVLYLESYITIQQKPYLLTKLGKFEIQLLNWMRKEKLLDLEILETVICLLPKVSRYEPVLLRVLEDGYRQWEDDLILDALCAYLIRGRILNERAAQWYLAAIKKQRNVMKLYEAYMMSVEDSAAEQIPDDVLRYFVYENHLPEEKKAQLYYYIVKNEEAFRTFYPQYEKTIVSFVLMQLKHGKMNKTLAGLYEEVLEKELVDDVMQETLLTLLFSVKADFSKQGVVKVYVLQEAFRQAASYPVYGNTAYITLYPGKSVLVYEDVYGRRFCNHSDYMLSELVNRGKIMALLGKRAKETIPFCLMHVLTSVDLARCNKDIETLLLSEKASQPFCKELGEKLLLDAASARQYTVSKKALEAIVWQDMSAQAKCEYVKQLCAHGMYQQAFGVMCGKAVVDKELLLKGDLLGEIIQKHTKEQEPFLLYYVAEALKTGCRLPFVIKYACGSFYGSVRQMALLWDEARKEKEDTFFLEERLLIQMMFCDVILDGAELIFENYYIAGGNERLIAAYQSFMSCHYLRGEIKTPQKLMGKMQLMCEQKEPLPVVCQRAVLKNLVLQGEWDDASFSNMEELLKEALINDEYYAFYEKLPEKLKEKYLLQLLRVAEYCGEEDEQAKFMFVNGDMCIVKELKPSCAGLYSTVIAADNEKEIRGYLQVVKNRSIHLSQFVLQPKPVDSYHGESRLSMLARIREAVKTGQSVQAKEEMKTYMAINGKLDEELHIL